MARKLPIKSGVKTSAKVYDAHTPEFYQAYADNRGLRSVYLPNNPFTLELVRAGTEEPEVGCCAFTAAKEIADEEDWVLRHRHGPLTQRYLEENLILERGKGKGESWWSLYGRNAVELAEVENIAIVVSRDVRDAMLPVLPPSAWVYQPKSPVSVIGHGASLRYFMSAHHALLYVDLDVEMDRQQRWLENLRTELGDGVGMIRTTGRARPDTIYRGVLGSRVFIRHAPEVDFAKAAYGQVLCQLSSGRPASFDCELPVKLTDPRFGEVWPQDRWDEYMLHTLFMPYFARKGEVTTMTYHSVPEDNRWAMDEAFCRRYEGNKFVTWK